MDVFIMYVFIDFYVKCGRVRSGRKIFDYIVVKDFIFWIIMIVGYMQNLFDVDVVELFCEMNRLGWKLDDFVCFSIFILCGLFEVFVVGKQVYVYIIKVNFEFDEFVKNGLIDMYFKCDSLVDARRVFDLVIYINVVFYNVMIEGYVRQEKFLEVLNFF